MEEIGNFLSNEYGLIKHIFKYLPNRDLYRARNVCRSWRSAVDILMEKKPVWTVTNESIDNFHRRIRPKFILLSIDNRKKKYICTALRGKGVTEVPECKSTKFCVCKYIDEETTICLLDSPKPLRTPVVKHSKGTEPVTTQCSSMLMLPEIPGVEFSTFSMTYEELLHIVEDDMEESLDILIGKDGGPLKCLLLFTSYCFSMSSSDEAALDTLVTKIEERVKHRFALGGGVLRSQCLIRNGGKSSSQPKILGVTIKGENVTAHSQILIDHDPNTDGYMKELADRLGQAPEDGRSRIAFIVQCLNKDRNVTVDSAPNSRQKVRLCDYELRCFTKYFPSVPIFGFMGYGEFGLDLAKMSPYGHQEKKKKTKHNHHVQFSDSSSIVVITFNQEEQSSSGD